MNTVLLVAHDRETLTLCRQILAIAGYEVLTAESGKDALRVLQNVPSVDLLFSAVIMPGMNGIELANRVRSTNPNTRVVLMSGYTPADVAEVAGGENPYAIIWKPFEAQSLVRMIGNVINQPASVSGQPANLDRAEVPARRAFSASQKG